MLSTFTAISTLLLAMAVLLMGTGLMGTALGLRAGIEHFSPTVTGVVMSAYFIGYVVGTYVCPRMIRRVGHIRAFSAMAAVAAASILAHGLLVHPLAWMVLRVISGLCMVGLYMTMESWLNVLASNSSRGRLFAVYQTINLLALAVGQFLVLIGDVAGMVPFALAAVLISLALVPVALTPVEQPASVPTVRIGLGHLYALSPTGLAGSLGSGLLNGTLWGMGPVFAHLAGLSNAGVATFMAAIILGGAVLQWPVGWLSDHRDRRIVLAGVGLCGAGFALLMGLFSGHGLAWMAVSGFFYGGMAFTVYGLSMAHLNDMLKPHEVLEAARGMMLMHGVGAMLGPMLGGALMHLFGPAVLMLFFAAVLLFVGGFGLLRKSIKSPPQGGRRGGFVPMLRTSQAAMEMDPRIASQDEAAAAARQPVGTPSH
ncbi:MAG: MFS transporter [Nitrospirota bacterium]|nr:MFS transporter [Nitrospirota bacterium]